MEVIRDYNGEPGAIRLTKDEIGIFCKALNAELKKIDKKIKKIESDPKNEGQATYQRQIDWLRAEFEERNKACSKLENLF